MMPNETEPAVNQELLRQLLQLISGAQRRLWLRVPWWDGAVPEAQEILKGLLDAKHRGVDVRVVLRGDRESAPVVRDLQANDVLVVLRRHEHGKELLSDGKHLFFSMNFTAKEIRVNHQNWFVETDPQRVEQHAADLDAITQNPLAADLVGQERWLEIADVVPTELLPFLRHERLNPLQSKAAPVILGSSGHTVVIAPTGAGKTVLGELAVLRAIKQDRQRAAWLVPARALAAELSELRVRWERLGVSVVELTGEDNLDSASLKRAQLWITTTEKFESLYRRGSLKDAFNDMGAIVVDEVHLVGDESRGATLEALLARLRGLSSRTRLVALSATAENASHVSAWLGAELVTSAWRPTQLTTQVVTYPDSDVGILTYRETEIRKTALVLDIVQSFSDESQEDGPGSVLIFCGSKQGVRTLAARIAGVPATADEKQLQDACMENGVGFCYRDAADGPSALSRFRTGDLRVLVATSAVAVGVNTPARAVIIRDLKLGKDDVGVDTVQQMFGRAGRSGHGESHGWGFLICPESLAGEWRSRIAAGFTVKSQIREHLGDAILAEVLVGGITSERQARDWFDQTLAAWEMRQSETPPDDDQHLEATLRMLATSGLLEISDAGAVRATPLGKITSQLMVDVRDAVGLLSVLREAPLPATADEAEARLLWSVSNAVKKFREPQVNARTYEDFVKTMLSEAAGLGRRRVNSEEPVSDFHAELTVAAVHIALRRPDDLKHRQWPQGASKQAPDVTPVSLTPIRDIVESLPRHLAWIAAIGHIGALTWQSPIANDLAQRLTWWRLEPSPPRGSGRALWLMSRAIPMDSASQILPTVWHTAMRRNPKRHADTIKEAELLNFINETLGVRGATSGAVSSHLEHRLKLSIEIQNCGTEFASVSVNDGRGRLFVQTACQGSISTSVFDDYLGGSVQVPLPIGTRVGKAVAFDVLWISQGDFAYAGLIDTAEGTDVPVEDPLDKAKELVLSLPMAAQVGVRAGWWDRNFNLQKMQREAALLMSSRDEVLQPLAHHLTLGGETDHERADKLRVGIGGLLRSLEHGDESAWRPPAEVLRSGFASQSERAIATVALAKTAGLTADLAVGRTSKVLWPLVSVASRWYILEPPRTGDFALESLSGEALPQTSYVLPPPPAREVIEIPAKPAFGFLEEFLPTLLT